MLSSSWRWSSLVLLALAPACPAAADEPAAALVAYPPEIKLSGKHDVQRFIAVLKRGDGVTQDVTAAASIQLVDPQVAARDGDKLTPVADGTTKLRVEFEGLAAEVPVTVSQAAQAAPVSFQNDVMPVFMRAGCNTGACHGAARGKDGFQLSLFGYDPAGDHHRLTREMGIRRINLALPAESLLLQKSIGAVPHTGGKRFAADTPYYAALQQWLASGAPNDTGQAPRVERVELFPPAAVLEGAQSAQRFVVVAHYSDGTDRDVTPLAVFLTSNDNSAAVNSDGLVTAHQRGEAFIMARFDTHTVVSQVVVLPKDLPYEPPPVTGNYIDQLVAAKLEKLRIVPSELCRDEEFLRRVTVDVCGQLPTPEEHAEFLADTAPDKRSRWIDRLLERKEFSEIWAMKWAELLMIKSTNEVSYKSAFLYYSWLTDCIANNVPLDEMVRRLLTASGGTFTQPATNYYQVERDTLKTAENTAQVFLGIRVQCAQCHNHPFDRWTMDDYYGFAAFFARIGRKPAEDYRETIVFSRDGGEVNHPVGGRVMAPKFLGGEAPDVSRTDRRQALAEWLTAPDNTLFATSVANRVWDHFFGLGIVEPVDDVRVSNPPSNPELYRTLGAKLVEYQYDFKQLVRDICNSHAYQRSATGNESNQHDERNFARAQVRRIRAEILLDCISQATETKDKFRGLPLGSRAVQVADGSTTTYFLTAFGRAPRTTVCACEVRTDPSLSQALHLINGATVHGKIAQGGLVKRWLESGQSPEAILESIYIRCLSRRPTAEEQKQLLASVAEAGHPQAGLDDVFWAVLNSREFIFNH